jgi:hypothetical protein
MYGELHNFFARLHTHIYALFVDINLFTQLCATIYVWNLSNFQNILRVQLCMDKCINFPVLESHNLMVQHIFLSIYPQI